MRVPTKSRPTPRLVPTVTAELFGFGPDSGGVELNSWLLLGGSLLDYNYLNRK
jgi:hypothetical protein